MERRVTLLKSDKKIDIQGLRNKATRCVPATSYTDKAHTCGEEAGIMSFNNNCWACSRTCTQTYTHIRIHSHS